MDFINFANTFVPSTTTTAAPLLQGPSAFQQPTDVKLKKKKTFTHANRVVFTAGPNKGYTGFVYDFIPSKIDLEIKDDLVVPQTDPPKNLGDTFTTGTGRAVVTGLIDPMYTVKMKETGELVTLPFHNWFRVVQYHTKDSVPRFGHVRQTNSDLCDVIPLSETTLTEIQSRIKSRLLTVPPVAPIHTHKCTESLPHETFVCLHPQNLGATGTYSSTTPQQLNITHYTRSTAQKQDLLVVKKGIYKIKGGPMKNRTGRRIAEIAAQVAVVIDANNQRVFVNPMDLFYLDATLKTGEKFQVNELLDDGSINGMLFDSGNKLKKVTVTKEDILQFEDTFTTKDTQPQSQPEQEFVDETEESANDAFVEEPVPDLGPDFQSTFSDFSRLSIAHETLPREMQLRLTLIESAIGKYAPNTTVNSRRILEFVTNAVTGLQSAITAVSPPPQVPHKRGAKGKCTGLHGEPRTIPSAFWKETDVKYIVATGLLIDLKREGYTFLSVTDNAVASLVSKKFFTNKDVKESLFITRGWYTGEYETDADFIAEIDTKPVCADAHAILLGNCIDALGKVVGHVEINAASAPKFTEMAPPTRKKVVDISAIFRGLPIPDDAEAVFYPPRFNFVKKTAIRATLERIPLASAFVRQHLENAPVLLTQFKNKKSMYAVSDLKQLNDAWNIYSKLLKTQYELTVSRRRAHSQGLESSNKYYTERGRRHSELKRKVHPDSDEESESEDLMDTEEANEAVLGKVSEDTLRESIARMIASENLDVLTTRQIKKNLEQEFGQDLTQFKLFIKSEAKRLSAMKE